MICLKHLSQGWRYRLVTKFVKKFEEHFSFFSKRNSFQWINAIHLFVLYGLHAHNLQIIAKMLRVTAKIRESYQPVSNRNLNPILDQKFLLLSIVDGTVP